MLGGVHHDAGLEYPVLPLGGVDYFNFDLGHKGIQTNVFFAGIVVAANATNPNLWNTRTNVGADLFAIAVPTTSRVISADIINNLNRIIIILDLVGSPGGGIPQYLCTEWALSESLHSSFDTD